MNVNFVLNQKEAKRAITIALEKNRPLMIWGPPGIGKSEVVAQIGAEKNREVIDIRLPLWEPTDIKGIPFFNPQTQKMEWAPPLELPHDPNSNAILFLDEINAAPPSVQSAAYQLVLNRKIGQYVLPKGVSIVAAGNRDSDRGITYKMPSPLANRFVHIEVKSDFDSWHEWAIKNKIHSSVIGYLSNSKQDLFDFDPKSSLRSFATPRSWTFVSQFLEDTDNSALSNESIMQLIGGSIGEGIALKFIAHLESYTKIPNVSDICDGKITKLEDELSISAIHSLITSLCYELNERHKKLSDDLFYESVDHFIRFITSNDISPEYSVVGIRNIIVLFNIFLDKKKMKTFSIIQEKFGKYIATALGIKD